MYCGMPKDTCRAKVASNSKIIKPVALLVIKLCLSEGISQSGSQSVSRKFHYFKISEQVFGSVSGHTKSTFGLGYT